MNFYQKIEDEITNAETLGESARVLENLLSGGYSIWEDGSLYEIRKLVERVNGLSIKIYPNEHPPPHFHVTGGGVNATFLIDDCELLKGDIKKRQLDLIKWWHKRAKENLIRVWNSTRPVDCPVGKVE